MTTNSRKSNTGTEDLARLFEVISKMPGSTPGDALPSSGGTNKPTNGTSRTAQPTSKAGVGSVPPNPDIDKSVTDGTVDLVVNQEKTDLGNTKSRRSRRVQVKPKTPRSTSAPTSPPSESIQPWYPPHFYPPWYLSPFQYPYTTPPAHYPPPMNSRMISHSSVTKQPTLFRFHAIQSPRENRKTNQPTQPGDNRTERNLMPDFDLARSEEAVNNEHEGGTDGGGDGNGDDDDDENWNGDSSEESDDESYVAEEEDTSDTGSSIPSEEPARTRQTHKEPSTSTRRNHRQHSTTRQTVIDMAAIRDMV